MIRTWVHATLIFLVTLTCVAPASGEGVRVSPVSIAFPASTGAGSVRIDNARRTPVSFQVDVYRWSQESGADVLTPTRELAVAPTVFEIAPGEGRLVRLALAPSQRRAVVEQSFRLILRELPTHAAQTGRSRVLLELSLPVFATSRDARPMLDINTEGSALHISNDGGAHVRIVGLGAENVSVASPRYLLARSRFSRPLPPSAKTVTLSYIPAGAHEIEREIIRLSGPGALHTPQR